jgi:hypothetical protein
VILHLSPAAAAYGLCVPQGVTFRGVQLFPGLAVLMVNVGRQTSALVGYDSDYQVRITEAS